MLIRNASILQQDDPLLWKSISLNMADVNYMLKYSCSIYCKHLKYYFDIITHNICEPLSLSHFSKIEEPWNCLCIAYHCQHGQRQMLISLFLELCIYVILSTLYKLKLMVNRWPSNWYNFVENNVVVDLHMHTMSKAETKMDDTIYSLSCIKILFFGLMHIPVCRWFCFLVDWVYENLFWLRLGL